MATTLKVVSASASALFKHVVQTIAANARLRQDATVYLPSLKDRAKVAVREEGYLIIEDEF